MRKSPYMSMKLKHCITAAILAGAFLMWLPSTAAAETEGEVNHLVWSVTSQLLTIVDGMLGFFVEGSTLSGTGEDLISSLASFVTDSANILAALSSWLYRAPT